METPSVGDRFDPNKFELLKHLRYKVEKGKNGYITDMNVYEDDPWLLQHVTPHPHFMEKVWFYFVPTTTLGGGRKPKRTVLRRNKESEGGTWRRIDQGRKRIMYNNATVGYKQRFVYCKKVKGNPKENRTDWYMKEYSLCDDDLQHWVLCKIQQKTREKKDNNTMMEGQEEECSLVDEFAKMKVGSDGEHQQETHVRLSQGQCSGFETRQSNNTMWWDDLMYELQKLPKILQAKDSRGFADQGLVEGDMMMYGTNRGLKLEN